MPAFPLIYAELLANIRQISVIAELPTPSSVETKSHAELSVDSYQLSVRHNGVTTSLKLPGEAASSFVLPALALGVSELSWRIPLRAQAASGGLEHDTEAVAPWPSNELSSATEIACRKCRTVLVTAGAITVWRDLPSENWAEMMDFWHCHKPSDHNKAGQNNAAQEKLAQKGYGANNSFAARQGVGLVDLTYFLLAEEDCPGIKISPQAQNSSTSPPPSLSCTTCTSHLGIHDTLSRGYRLYKWSLELTTTNHPQPSAPPLSHFLAAHFHAQISAQAVHRFVIHAQSSAAAPTLHIWVFAPRLTISISTSAEPPDPVPAMKIFYAAVTQTEMGALLEKASFAVEEVQLPALVVEEFARLLTESTARLPLSARKFGLWHVGFLERFIQS